MPVLVGSAMCTRDRCCYHNCVGNLRALSIARVHTPPTSAARAMISYHIMLRVPDALKKKTSPTKGLVTL